MRFGDLSKNDFAWILHKFSHKNSCTANGEWLSRGVVETWQALSGDAGAALYIRTLVGPIHIHQCVVFT
jgi:hypothetical protein